MASATPGSTVRFTVTITDTGQTPYTGIMVTDSLSGLLDDAGYNGDASATAGTVSYTSPVLTWTGTLAAGAAATVTFSVTVNSIDTGDKTLGTTVSTAAAGSNCAGREHGRAVLDRGAGAGPGAGPDRDREHLLRHARVHRGLHDRRR